MFGVTIQRNDHRQDTNTKAGNKAAAQDVVDALRTGLNYHTNNKHYSADKGCVLATKGVGEKTVDQDTNPGTEFQNTIDSSSVEKQKSIARYSGAHAVKSPRETGFLIDSGRTVAEKEYMLRI